MWKGKHPLKWGSLLFIAVAIGLVGVHHVRVTRQVTFVSRIESNIHQINAPTQELSNQQAYDTIQKEKIERGKASLQSQAKKEPTKVQKPTDQSKKKTQTPKEQPKKPVIPPPTKQNQSAGHHVVYLTIDDGPSAVTRKFIDLLNQYHMKATFFMLEPNMRTYPNALITMTKEGFGVGLHGVTHDKDKFYKSKQTVVGEMTTAQNTLKKITGVKTRLIRVPYGSVPYMTVAYRDAVKNAGFIMWDWNIDSRDWDFKDSRYVTSTIQQFEHIQNSNQRIVILIHDRSETLKYLPQLLNYFRAHHDELRVIDSSMAPVQFRPR